MKLYKPEEYYYLYNLKKKLIIVEDTLFLKNECLKISMCNPNVLKFFVLDPLDWDFMYSDIFSHKSFVKLFNEKYK